MTDSEQLMTVAAWIDKMFPNDPDPEVQTDLRRIAVRMVDIERELARVKEAATVLARWCAESLDDMMPGYVCENHTASALVRAAKDQA